MVEEQTGRPLSSPQTHQKTICTWNSFHGTTSEGWRRTPDVQKSKPISSEGGRAKDKDEKGNKGFWNGDLSWGGSRGGEVPTQQETLSQVGSVGSLGTPEGKHKESKLRKFTTATASSGNHQPCSGGHALLQPVGAGCRGSGCTG